MCLSVGQHVVDLSRGGSLFWGSPCWNVASLPSMPASTHRDDVCVCVHVRGYVCVHVRVCVCVWGGGGGMGVPLCASTCVEPFPDLNSPIALPPLEEPSLFPVDNHKRTRSVLSCHVCRHVHQLLLPSLLI